VAELGTEMVANKIEAYEIGANKRGQE